MIGRTFDNRYDILRKIGSGGMAEVYLAHDGHLERDVALKVLSTRYAEDDQFVERFRREASNAAGLNHANIVQIYDRGEAEGTYYIAMEYLEGRSLKEIIVRYAPLEARHIVSIAGQILEALRFAHRKGIVHRDIKPQNIMVDDEGRVKVTDFGIARAATASRMTDTGSIVGTAQYLSPEQAQGVEVGPQSDLYSLGVVMYEMAAGALPFEGDNPVAIAMKHVHEPPAPLESVPEGLQSVIMRSLAKDPEDRYADADAFLEDLRRVEEGEAVAPPPAFDESATRVMGAGAAVGAAAAAGDTTRVARTSQTMVRPRGEEPYTAPADEFPPDERRPWWPWLLVLLFVVILAGTVFALVSSFGDDTAEVDVPDVIGLTLEEAERDLEAAGLELGEVETEENREEYADFEAGQIVRQAPEPDVLLDEGSGVDVWVLAEEELVAVPDVVGATQEEASTTLGMAELLVEVQERASEDVEEGRVIEQAPAAGEEVERNSTVTIVVSTGPDTEIVELPDLTGRSRGNATGVLEGLGLEVDIVEEASDQDEGTVIGQNPGPGSEVEAGSTVTLTVSSGPPLAQVPGVVGESEEAARNLIRDAGLNVQTQTVTDESSPGTVVDQNPDEGRRVERGTTVTIWVSTGPPTTTTIPPGPTTTLSGG